MHTFEEVYFMVSGLTPIQAHRKAKKLGSRKNIPYKNMYGESVSWRLAKFVGIQETTDQKFRDGSEVHFRFFKGLKSRASKGG